MITEICGHAVLLGLLASDPGRYDLLLVTNPGVGPPEGVPPLARRVLHLQFEDFDSPRPRVRLPAAGDVRLALEWSAGAATWWCRALHYALTETGCGDAVLRGPRPPGVVWGEGEDLLTGGNKST